MKSVLAGPVPVVVETTGRARAVNRLGRICLAGAYPVRRTGPKSEERISAAASVAGIALPNR